MHDLEPRVARFIFAQDGPADPAARLKMNLLGAAKDVEVDRILVILHDNPNGFFTTLDLYDHLRLYQKPVDTLVSGFCSSGKFLVLQAGKKRFATENTWFQLHPIVTSTARGLRADDIDMASQQITELNELAKRIVLERSNRALEDIKNLAERAVMLTAQTALDHGYIDEIVRPYSIKSIEPAKPSQIQML